MLKLSRLADYGVVLMTHMAGARDHVRSAQAISDATGIPLPTVSKLLSGFARAGLLQAVRGAKGGFRLARDPGQISVSDVIAVVDGPIALTLCLEEGASNCELEWLCPSRFAWGTINRAVQQALTDLTVADLLMPPSSPFEPWGLSRPAVSDKQASDRMERDESGTPGVLE